MMSLPSALLLAFGQLSDTAILKVLGKSLAITLAIFAVIGALVWWVVAEEITSFAGAMGDDDYTGIFATLITVLIVGFGGWLLFRIIALAVIQFFADEVVRAVERKHYPGHANTPGLPFKTELRHSIRAAARALGVNLLAAPIALLLLFTGIGSALVFWAANAFLLGRELQDMVWLRHQHDDSEVTPINGLNRFALGGVIALLLAVPFANFFAPILGAAAATHLVHNRKPAPHGSKDAPA